MIIKDSPDWKMKSLHIVTLGIQSKLTISHHQLDFFSKEFQEGLDNINCDKDSNRFAQELLEAIGDHLSRRNLKDLIVECNKRLEEWVI